MLAESVQGSLSWRDIFLLASSLWFCFLASLLSARVLLTRALRSLSLSLSLSVSLSLRSLSGLSLSLSVFLYGLCHEQTCSPLSLSLAILFVCPSASLSLSQTLPYARRFSLSLFRNLPILPSLTLYFSRTLLPLSFLRTLSLSLSRWFCTVAFSFSPITILLFDLPLSSFSPLLLLLHHLSHLCQALTIFFVLSLTPSLTSTRSVLSRLCHSDSFLSALSLSNPFTFSLSTIS